MNTSRNKMLSLAFALLIVVSAACSGFLVGRTTKLHEQGKFEQLQQVSERVAGTIALVHRSVEIVKRSIFR